MTMNLRSAAFSDGQTIPVQYTGDGQDVSPPLVWEGVPPETKELALICDDPDAPTPEPWVHWLLYKIPADVQSLPQGVAATPQLDVPAGALQGHNSWTAGRQIGYRGPAPPPGHGLHHYHFKLYALDTVLDPKPELEKEALLAAMKDHILATAELIGTFER